METETRAGWLSVTPNPEGMWCGWPFSVSLPTNKVRALAERAELTVLETPCGDSGALRGLSGAPGSFDFHPPTREGTCDVGLVDRECIAQCWGRFGVGDAGSCGRAGWRVAQALFQPA